MAIPPKEGVTRVYEVRLSKDKRDDLWYADVVNMQGCHGMGTSEQEALDSALESLKEHFSFRIENHRHPKFGTPAVFPKNPHGTEPHTHSVELQA